MIKNNSFYYAALIAMALICAAQSCKTGASASLNQPNYLGKGKKQAYTLVDSTKAADLIITDNTDDIFNKMTTADMSIQMKRNYNSDYLPADIANDYLTFVQKDVSTFKPDEIEFVNEQMAKAFDLCQKISPNIFPKNINIIKTKSRYYGDGVYFTRENCIIVPANALKEKQKEDFLNTMLHEIFHVYSRLNPEKRKALYEVIGFREINQAAQLEVPEPLKSQILLNPDGTNYRYYITLQASPDRQIKAIPIIYSSSDKFNPKKRDFFNYMRFELFEIQPAARGFIVATKKDGSSTLNIKELPDFDRQIKDNTNYIIHPDEILADNFMMLANQQPLNAVRKNFSAEGKNLLEEIRLVLVK